MCCLFDGKDLYLHTLAKSNFELRSGRSCVDEGSIEKTDDFQLNGLTFEHNQSKSKSALLCITCISPCCPAYMIPMTLLTNK
jgi:hypothetical protein